MTFVQMTTASGLTADQYDAIMQAAHGVRSRLVSSRSTNSRCARASGLG
jgi:hypothetical protein